MEVAVIVAEYNPFHNGHMVHLSQTRLAGASHVAVVMGGNFLQRGEAALFEKRERARAALLGGADLILELPICYAMATAERFAFGAVATAGALGCVDLLSFGCESGKVEPLGEIATLLDTPAFSTELKGRLGTGVSFAKARQAAVAALLGEERAALLGEPNNILGVEYLRQLRLQNLPIRPLATERVGTGHHGKQAAGEYASASLIRSLWRENPQSARPYLPPSSWEVFSQAGERGLGAVDQRRLEAVEFSCLRRLSAEEIQRLPDVGEGLEHRLYAAIRAGVSLQDILARAKTKRYSLSRLRRILLAAYLGLEGSAAGAPPPYLRVLGYNRRGTEILAAARKTKTLPLSDSLARLEREGGRAAEFARVEAASTDQYTATLTPALPCGYDYTAPPVRLL